MLKQSDVPKSTSVEPTNWRALKDPPSSRQEPALQTGGTDRSQKTPSEKGQSSGAMARSQHNISRAAGMFLTFLKFIFVFESSWIL